MSNMTLYRTLAAALIILQGVRGLAAHPLDPLSGKEMVTAVGVLRAAGEIDAATRFALIDLDEPPKADVLAWKPGQPFARKAFIVVRRRRTVYEAVVDLSARVHRSGEPRSVRPDLGDPASTPPNRVSHFRSGGAFVGILRACRERFPLNVHTGSIQYALCRRSNLRSDSFARQ